MKVCVCVFERESESERANSVDLMHTVRKLSFQAQICTRISWFPHVHFLHLGITLCGIKEIMANRNFVGMGIKILFCTH